MPEAGVGSAAESDSRREFCTRTAERVLALVPATTVLDAGCGSGLLVHAFVVKGVDATGIAVSDHDISAAHPDIRDRLRVGSLTDIEGHYDLITCIDVLEHLAPRPSPDVIDAMTSATERIVFSASPLASPRWAALFAERGFFRRADADLSFLTPWAILLERGEPSPRELVARYEAVLAPLLDPDRASREGSHDSTRGGAGDSAGERGRVRDRAGDDDESRRLEDEVRAARHDLLVSRDQVIGSEAEVGRVNRDLTRLAAELRTTTRKLRRTTERRDELQQKLGRTRGRSEQQAQALRDRVAQLEGELAAARASFPRRVARGLRRRLR